MPKYTIKPLKPKQEETTSKEKPKANPTVAKNVKVKINPDVRKTPNRKPSDANRLNRGGKIFIAVKSSNLKAYSYDEKTRELFILFNTNRVYKYLAVPKATVTRLTNASSKGTYFTAHIRYKYTNREVKNM